MGSGYAAAVEAAGNYHSGDDYVVEFLGYRFSFNSLDFEERVTAAAVRLGLVAGPELDEEETADLVELVERARGIPRTALGRARARPRRIARLLAEEARLPRRLARPSREGRPARGRLGRRSPGRHVCGHERRPRTARSPPHAELARAAVPPVTAVPRRYALLLPAYLAVLLAVDTQVGHSGQIALGVLTFAVLAVAP